MDHPEYTVTHNEPRHRFEINLEGETAFLEYRFYRKDISLLHTEVPKKFEGRGLGNALVKYAFKYAEENQLPVIVYCPFVAAFLKRHHEYDHLLDKEYRK